MLIFQETAPKYWAKAISVIPLRPKAKVPALNAWSQYATCLPTPEQRETWIEAYAEGNIGMALGPQSGIIALDLDSTEDKVLEILQKIMPKSPWKRTGKKGAVWAFKYNGERTFRIKDEDNNTIVELLSRGTQVVLPPSIHPDTQMPYTATCELYDVVDQLPGLPADFEHQLRQALIAAGFKLSSRGGSKVAEWVPAGGRDSAMVALAGILARAVIRGERTLLEATHEMEVWVNTYTEKVAGDPLDPQKAMKKVVEFVRDDIVKGGRRLPSDWSDGMTSAELEYYRDFFGDDSEEWTVADYVSSIAEVAMNIPVDDIAARDDAIDKILVRIAKAQHLTELNKSTLLKQIQLSNGKHIQYAALKARIRELSSTEMMGETHVEIGEALVAELEREGEVRYHNGEFYRWMGASWEPLPEHVIYRTLFREFGHFAAARRFSDHRGIMQVLQKLRQKPLAEVDVYGVNFANGYLTTDMQLLNHDPKFGATYVLPYRYVTESRLPIKFLTHLDRCWGMEDDFAERVQALREAIAATLFGVAHRYSRAFCLFGLSHSGKSTIIDTIKGLLPDEAVSTIPPEKWADRFSPVLMAGKLMNFGGETSDDKLIPGQIFKLIVEGEQITVERKGQDPFKVSLRCAHWFGGNHLPRSRDMTGGFTRRWLFLDFNHRIETNGRTAKYHEEILNEEREDIVAWALPAIIDLMGRQDYTLPACHLRREAEVASFSNSVRAYVDSTRVAFAKTHTVKQKEIYDDYYAWARMESRVQPYSMKRFQMTMEEVGAQLGFGILKHTDPREVVYHGITLDRLVRKAAA